MSDETKTCSFCREQIHREARKCPRCQQWHGWSRLFAYAPVLMIFLMLLAGNIWLGHTRRRFIDPEDFRPYREKIVLIESTMHYSKEADCPGVSVVGRLRNDSEIPWKDPQFEVRFYNAAGKLIDAYPTREYGMLLPAHGEAAFKLRSHADKPEMEYAKHEVEIKSARDARSVF